MSITDKLGLYNDVCWLNLKFNPTSSLFIPDWCYKRILLANGRTDFIGITILAELMSLQQLSGHENSDFVLHSCFTHFWERFFIKKPRVQRASARLQNTGLVSPSFTDTRNIYGTKFLKELTLTLDASKVISLQTVYEQAF